MKIKKFLTINLVFLAFSLSFVPSFTSIVGTNSSLGIIHLPKTGQTISYHPGDDGDLQVGVESPDPRFIDNNDGTVSDILTGLMWSKNADLAGSGLTWPQALQFIDEMNTGINDNFGYADWRLPNVLEYRSMVDHGSYSHTPNIFPFSNIISFGHLYWTSTSVYYWPHLADFYAWSFSPLSGSIHVYHKNNDFPPHFAKMHLWPIRSDQSGAISIPKTGQTISYYPGDDGDLQVGVESPDPRFIDNNDGTVTDYLSGLMWTQNANLAGVYNTWEESLQYIENMNQGIHENFGYTDWRAPNVIELQSLRWPCDPGNYFYWPCVNNEDNLFSNVQGNYYWASTTYSRFTAGAWIVHMYDGTVGSGTKLGAPFGQGTWPVRTAELNIIPATIDFDPNTLNLKNNGFFVTVYLELSPEYDLNEIDVSSITLNDVVYAELKPYTIGDYDNDGIPDLSIKFLGSDVISILEIGEEVEITIKGTFGENMFFEGTDIIRVI
ncbi:MAG: Lcl C-terminal domain-containing protein [Candidatus Hodarchaeales archaeon]|jgi:hypothetical protein